MTKSQITNKINKAICGAATGIFSDEYWAGVKIIQDSLADVVNELGLEHHLVKTTYKVDEDTLLPTSKRWMYEVVRDGLSIFVTVVAAGAGTVFDPLSRYDVVAYAS